MFLEINKLRKSFGGIPVVTGLDLALTQGEILCLLGSSGCGKTTTLRMIGGFLTPDEGSIFLDGQDILPLPPEHRPVATVFQSYALFPNMNVLQNVTYGLRLQGIKKAERKARGMEYLRLAGLEDHADSRIHELSGGQQQRAALMRALILRPKVLLLDEPLSNLDAKLREKMRGEIKELQRRFGITMIFVTHDREEAMTLADRVAVMEAGEIRQIGTPEELYTHPCCPFVMDFFGDVNQIKSAQGDIRYLRPEDLRFDDQGEIEGVITKQEFLGYYRRYEIKTAGKMLTVFAPKETPYAVGTAVRLSTGNADSILRFFAD